MYLSFSMLTVKNYESHSPAGRSLSVLFTYLFPFSSSRTKFAFYVEADWPVALLMEGRRRMIKLGKAREKRLEERVAGVCLLG